MGIKQDFEYPDSIDQDTQDLFDEAQDKLYKKIQRYSESIKRSLALNDLNTAEKAMVAPTIHHGYINCLFAERAYLKKLERALEKQKDAFYDEFGGLDGKPKYVIDREISKRGDIKKLEDSILIQKDLVYYLEDTCKVMSNFGYAVKNSIEVMKMM